MKLFKRTSIVLGMAFLFLACGINVSSAPIKSLEGVWVGRMPNQSGDQVFVFLFEGKRDGLTCTIHSYMNKVKFEGMRCSDLKYSPPAVSFIANKSAGVRYEAVVDTMAGNMKGKLIYANGASNELMLKHYTPEATMKEFPGIAQLMDGSGLQFQTSSDFEDGLNVSAMNPMQIDTSLIREMVQKIDKGDYGVVNSILIAIDDNLTFEEYFGGYAATDLQGIRSVTKSIAALCLGIAIDQGKIKDVNEKVVDFFPEYAQNCPPGWDKITLQHLLTMSMGLDWGDGLDQRISAVSNNIVKDVLSRPVKLEPGQTWEYRSPNVNLIAGIIKKATGMHADKFTKKFLFEPLGITHFNWELGKQNGYPRLDGTLAMQPRDLMKIGLMIMHKGKYDGKQIVSETWVDQCRQSQIRIDDVFSYGYLWWRAVSRSDPGAEIIFANGLGGHHIVLVPKYHLVVVTAGGNYDERKMKLIMNMIDSHIIKAMACKSGK